MRTAILISFLITLLAPVTHGYCVQKRHTNELLRRPHLDDFHEFMDRFKEWQKKVDRMRRKKMVEKLEKSLKLDLKKMLKELDREIDRALDELD